MVTAFVTLTGIHPRVPTPRKFHRPNWLAGYAISRSALQFSGGAVQLVLKERLHGHVTTGEAGFEMAPTSATQCQIDAGLFRLALISQKGNKLCT